MWSLYCTVFLTGAAVMMFEMAGARVLAPYVGNSIFVWTALIGVVLASLSVGYWYGGRLADKHPTVRALAFIILSAAFLVSFIVLFKEALLLFVIQIISGVRAQAVASAVVLFALPSVLLGMVSPFAVRIATQSVDNTGKTAGTLYAISTAGSIAGTFGCGFWLLLYLGNTKVLVVVVAILLLAALCAYWPYIRSKWGISFFIVTIFFSATSLFAPRAHAVLEDKDSLYNRIMIYEMTSKDGDTLRYLLTSGQENQAGVYVKKPDELLLPYSYYGRMDEVFNPHAQRLLLIGGGGYTIARDFLARHPKGEVHAVEIDPVITQMAEKYFFLDSSDTRLTLAHEDGRMFVRSAPQKFYDVVFIDAFNGHTIPYQLTTVEAHKEIKELLAPQGVLVANLIGSLKGNGSRFVGAEYETLSRVYSTVLVFPVFSTTEEYKMQNIILVASDMKKSDMLQKLNTSKASLAERAREHFFDKTFDEARVLTDDFAPVDQYMLGTF